MSGFQGKPLAVVAPVTNEAPSSSDWGQVVRVAGTVDTGGAIVNNSAISSLTVSVTSVVVAVANPARQGLAIFNDSNRTVFIRLAAGPATLSNWSIRLRPRNLYELPHPFFLGEVSAIWRNNGSGQLRITEFS